MGRNDEKMVEVDVEKSGCVDLLARGSGLEIKVFPNVKYPHAKVLLIYIIRTFTSIKARKPLKIAGLWAF